MKINEIEKGIKVIHPYFGKGIILNEVLLDGKPSGACMVQFVKYIEPLDVACYYLTKIEEING